LNTGIIQGSVPTRLRYGIFNANVTDEKLTIVPVGETVLEIGQVSIWQSYGPKNSDRFDSLILSQCETRTSAVCKQITRQRQCSSCCQIIVVSLHFKKISNR